MRPYQIYGEVLASDVIFPELQEAGAGQPTWVFRVATETGPAAQSTPAALLGEQTIYPGCRARLLRTPHGLRIAVDDTGVYDLTEDNRRITWYPAAGATDDFGRGHLMGRVLATAMHAAGDLVLHGSAVAYPSGAVLFLAPKHSGKSTLALALTLAGAKLISDDTIAIREPEGDHPMVRPGVHSLRLFPDSANRLRGEAGGPRREDGKQLVADLTPEQLRREMTPLAAVYLLAPAESIEGGKATGRRRMPQPLAAAAMVGQGKISEMLGTAEAPVLLRRAARIASRVPVYRLAVHRDLTRLQEVAAQLAEWHGSRVEAK